MHHALRLRTGTSKTFLKRHGANEMFQELKLVFQTHAHGKKATYYDKHVSSRKCIFFIVKMEENSSTSEHVLRLSGYYNRLNQVGVNLPDKIVIDRVL